MTDYRGFKIDFDGEDRFGSPVTIITAPNGDEWHGGEDPEAEIDAMLEESETMTESYERNEDWRRRQYELV